MKRHRPVVYLSINIINQLTIRWPRRPALQVPTLCRPIIIISKAIQVAEISEERLLNSLCVQTFSSHHNRQIHEEASRQTDSGKRGSSSPSQPIVHTFVAIVQLWAVAPADFGLVQAAEAEEICRSPRFVCVLSGPITTFSSTSPRLQSSLYYPTPLPQPPICGQRPLSAIRDSSFRSHRLI